MSTFVLLHGAWHDPWCWQFLKARLEEMGHAAVNPDLPLHDPEAGYMQRVQPAIDALEGVDDEVVVVAHSQSSALGPLVVSSSPASALVYLCPRMGGIDLPDGAPEIFREGIPFPSARPDGTTVWDPDTATEVMYPQLPPEIARELAERLRPMAMPPDGYPLQEHPDIPTSLIYAADDELFEPSFERFAARDVLGIDPIELSGGHFQMLEDPDRLAALLDGLPWASGASAAD
jgi:pimeloyl-ACP methyl ester carboxylesterase